MLSFVCLFVFLTNQKNATAFEPSARHFRGRVAFGAKDFQKVSSRPRTSSRSPFLVYTNTLPSTYNFLAKNEYVTLVLIFSKSSPRNQKQISSQSTNRCYLTTWTSDLKSIVSGQKSGTVITLQTTLEKLEIRKK